MALKSLAADKSISRFTLLQKIRVAKRFSSIEGRRQLVCNRLMAINVFLQSVHNPEHISAFFMAEGELVNEIIALVEAEKLVPESIRTLALKAIAVQVFKTSNGCNQSAVSNQV